MKSSTSLFRIFAICSVALLLMAVAKRASAQSNQEPKSLETVGAGNEVVETNVGVQLLQAYIRLQAQLNDAQLAIERNRAAYEKSAREQASDISQKLSSIQSALEADRTRQQEELRRSNETLLWVAGIFGCAGMLAMLFTAMFQWRTMNRVSEITAWRPQLAAGSANPLLPAENDLAGGKVVELSNQRLMAVIERLERRVFELEHTTENSGDQSTADGESAANIPSGAAGEIATLLNKGQSLLNEDQAEEALKCYDQILELEPNHPEALVKKGAALERLKQDEEALRCYDRAIEADRTLTIAYLYKGGVFNRLERYNEALECYEQALRAQAQPA